MSAGGQFVYARIFWKGRICNLNCQKIKLTKLLFFTAIVLVWSGLCCLRNEVHWLFRTVVPLCVRESPTTNNLFKLTMLSFPTLLSLHIHSLSRKQITKLVKPVLSVLDELWKRVQGKIRLRRMKYIGF